MDAVFKALADRNRRTLLDALFTQDGQSLSELCEDAVISRQAISKHLAILERAGLVVTHRVGREKLHYLNPIPLQQVSERWLSRYARRRAAAISALKKALEK